MAQDVINHFQSCLNNTLDVEHIRVPIQLQFQTCNHRKIIWMLQVEEEIFRKQ